jgi:hypothetical protein
MFRDVVILSVASILRGELSRPDSKKTPRALSNARGVCLFSPRTQAGCYNSVVSTYLSPLVTMDATLRATLVAAFDSE